MAKKMQWANALSTRPSLEAAVTEVVQKVTLSLSATPDLGIVFISSAFASDYPRLLPLILEKLPLPVLIGCGGVGIVGMNPAHQAVELEETAALSLTVAYLPEVEVQPFYLSPHQVPDLDGPPEAWSDLIGVPPEKHPQFILLSAPFSSRINDLLQGLDFAYLTSPKVGGLSSSTVGLPGTLFYHSLKQPLRSSFQEGTVGIALTGNIVMDTIVAQGCRPIGKPYRVSECDRNILLELVEDQYTDPNTTTSCTRPPLQFLRDIVQTLSEPDRQLAQHSLFIGIARDEFQLQLRQGDFLIRNLLGVEPRSGAMAIGDRVRPGQRIQFHLRDARTSAEDLQLLLGEYQEKLIQPHLVRGALMFSCLGRGETLYGMPNFDSGLFQRYLNNVPLGGFFCNGEIGPVGGSTFLHGYTSAFAIFREP